MPLQCDHPRQLGGGTAEIKLCGRPSKAQQLLSHDVGVPHAGRRIDCVGGWPCLLSGPRPAGYIT